MLPALDRCAAPRHRPPSPLHVPRLQSQGTPLPQRLTSRSTPPILNRQLALRDYQKALPPAFVGAVASAASTAQKTQHTARAPSTSSAPKYPPGKKAPPTTIDPRDPLFEPPTEGIVHYHDAAGNVHVITAPGVSVPSSYNSVDVKTSEQAVALHEAAQAAAAAAVEATAAQALLEARASASTPVINALLLSEKEQFVLPKSLRTPAEQAFAVKTMKALHHQVDCAQKQALASKQEINDLLGQVQELYSEKRTPRRRT